jgi:hypothetical protein
MPAHDVFFSFAAYRRRTRLHNSGRKVGNRASANLRDRFEQPAILGTPASRRRPHEKTGMAWMFRFRLDELIVEHGNPVTNAPPLADQLALRDRNVRCDLLRHSRLGSTF